MSAGRFTAAFAVVGVLIAVCVNALWSLFEHSIYAGHHYLPISKGSLLLFPPFSWALSMDLGAAVAHHRIANESARLPLMLYQASVGAGAMAYTPQVLSALLALPDVVAIKEGSWESDDEM